MKISPNRKRWLARSLMLFATLGGIGGAHAEEILVFAAASLKPALDAITATPEAQAIGGIKTSYAASSQLARQIEHGAPAAIFISADQDWMDHVAKLDLIDTSTRIDLLGNALVLIAPTDSSTELRISTGFPLADALGKDGRLALGEPNSVPAGKYAKAALITLGVWESVGSRVVSADNVRAALNFVARKEASLGIVYRSDAASEPTVRVVDTFPESAHPAIVYPAAIVKQGDSKAARQLLTLLRGSGAREIFIRYGFDVRTQ